MTFIGGFIPVLIPSPTHDYVFTLPRPMTKCDWDALTRHLANMVGDPNVPLDLAAAKMIIVTMKERLGYDPAYH